MPLVTQYESQYGPPEFAHAPKDTTRVPAGSAACSARERRAPSRRCRCRTRRARPRRRPRRPARRGRRAGLRPPEGRGHELDRAAGQPHAEHLSHGRGTAASRARSSRIGAAGPGAPIPGSPSSTPPSATSASRCSRTRPAEPRRAPAPSTPSAKFATRGPDDGTRARERGRCAEGWWLVRSGPARPSSEHQHPRSAGRTRPQQGRTPWASRWSSSTASSSVSRVTPATACS